MIVSIHYISVIFSNSESICIIPGLIKDLARKYYVSNPHILPPRCASGVYLSNNWYVLSQRNSGWVFDNISQVKVHGSKRSGPRVKIQPARFLPASLRNLTASGPWFLHLGVLLNPSLATVVAKVLPKLFRLLVGIKERIWGSGAPNPTSKHVILTMWKLLLVGGVGRSPEGSRAATFSRTTGFQKLKVCMKLLPDQAGGASR